MQSLTPREREVLDALADGLSQKEIAWRLGISASRVRDIVARIRLKAGASTTLQAVLRLRAGRA